MIDMKWENGLLGFVSMFVLPPAGHKGLYFFVCFIDLMVKQTSPQSQWATSSCRNTDLGRQLVLTIASCSPIDLASLIVEANLFLVSSYLAQCYLVHCLA